MPDEKKEELPEVLEASNLPMPESAKPYVLWASWILALCGPSLSAVLLGMNDGLVKQILTAVLGVLLAVAASLKSGLSNPLKKIGPATLVVVLFLFSGCANKYATAWHTLDAIQQTRDTAANQLAAFAKIKHLDCLKMHGGKTPEYAVCIKGSKSALDHWRKIARPAINTSIQLTATTVNIAQKAKTNVDWKVFIKPGICSLVNVANQFKDYFPDKAKSILGLLVSFKWVVCDEK